MKGDLVQWHIQISPAINPPALAFYQVKFIDGGTVQKTYRIKWFSVNCFILTAAVAYAGLEGAISVVSPTTQYPLYDQPDSTFNSYGPGWRQGVGGVDLTFNCQTQPIAYAMGLALMPGLPIDMYISLRRIDGTVLAVTDSLQGSILMELEEL